MIRVALVLVAFACALAFAHPRTPQVQLTNAVVQPGPKVLTLEQWRWVHRHFAGDEYRAARTAWCESEFRDDVVGAANEVGRLQVLPATARSLGYEPESLVDPEISGQVAVKLLARQPNWRDWSTRGGCPSWP